MRTDSHSKAPAALRFGVLGCANIARQFVRDASTSPVIRFDAVASRDLSKAQAFAVSFSIPRCHGSYEALLADPDIDVIYLPLPNSMHAHWAVAALEHGKHVLCEKPLALTAAEARNMFDAARRNQRMLLEAYPWWFQPQTADLLKLLHGDGAGYEGIGEIRSIQTNFGFTIASPAGNIRLDPGLGGGALLDAGSYTLSLIRLVMDAAPVRVTATPRWADSGVDIAMSATLEYSDGRIAQMSCAMDSAMHRHAYIVGSRGVIDTEFLNHSSDQSGHPWGYLGSAMKVRKGIAGTIPFETISSATGSGFRFAAEAFARVVAEQDFAAIERAAAASVDIAACLQAIAQSARSGVPVRLL